MRAVTLDEALAELEIDRAAGTDGARRAYLRLLKTRKPETDPAGFMRLREAYELVKADLVFWEPSLPAEMELSIPRFKAAPEPEPAEVLVEEPRRDEIADMGRLSRGRGVASEDEHEHEDERDDEHEHEDEDEDEDEEEDEDEDKDADKDEVVDPRGIDELMRAGAYMEAAAAMGSLFQAASKHLFETPPVREALRMMLTLHSKGAVEAASTLQKSFASWLAASGQEARVLRGELTVLWTLVRELSGLSSSLPDPVRSAIARAALSGDLAHAKGDLASFRIQRRSAAFSAGGMLRRGAPTIAAALADTLDPPPPVVPSTPHNGGTSGRGAMAGGWVIIAVLIGLVRIFASVGSSRTPSYYSPPSLNLPKYTLPTPMVGFDGGLLLPSRLDQLRATALSRASAVESDAVSGYPYISKKAGEIGAAIESRNCPVAKSASKVLRDLAKRNLPKSGAELLNAEVLLLDFGVHDYCTELGDAGSAAPRASASAAPPPRVPAPGALGDGGKKLRL